MNAKDFIKKVRQYPVVFATGAISLLLLLVIVLRLGSINAQEQRVQDLEDQVQKMSRNVDNSRDLPAHLERIEAINAQIDNSLINPDNKASNLDYFYSQEENTGVRISSVSQQSAPPPSDKKGPKPPKGAPVYSLFQPVKFDVTAQGNFGDIVTFIHRMASDRYLAKVSSVQINILQGDENATLTTNVVVEMLASAPEEKTAKGPK